ncbi:glutathione S-transferase N-terminal domain-containing protein [Novosphingobium sp. BL-52-GroH]|uniref:glutathione S-transferase N-terminal domain-containing protein n=1 Tax=Novosphingobium sp. BL-52-GroH TaxID=3349877 RepID=UPI003851509B
MTDDTFRPTLYFNAQCPFCLKVKIFLIEAGLGDSVDIVEFTPGSAEEPRIKQALAVHLDKVTVPAAEVAPGEYIADSDGIITRIAARAGIDPEGLPVLSAYKQVALDRIIGLFKENAELKRQLA